MPEALLWPQTLLPEVIPKARIFTWGYDADVDGFMSSASQNTIHQHANNLLSDLADLRSDLNDQSTPIIFVVHSLGGIVVKDALNQSNSTERPQLKCIAPATYGIVFLGTPHRGSKSATIGKFAYQISAFVAKSPNIKLFQALERNSETLDSIGDMFSQTLSKHHIQVISFREEKKTRKFLIFQTMVVNADSAKIGLSEEEIRSIPSNHSKMTKFGSSESIGFQRVSSQIRRWVEKVSSNEDTPTPEPVNINEFLQSLDIEEARIRIGKVDEAHDETFGWLFDSDRVPFSEWLQGKQGNDKPIFWIQGKPGSGKSTLMKFAMRNARTVELLATGSNRPWKLAAFFFDDQGSDAQKSLSVMLHEIIRSIISQYRVLWSLASPIYQKLVRSQRTKKPKWDHVTLKEVLLMIVKQRRFDLELCLFLDALDEHKGDNELLSKLLKEVVESADGEKVQVKMCVASRSWTIFSQHFGTCPNLAVHEHTEGDIRILIESRLSAADPQRILDQEQFMVIVYQISHKALGVFIWVKLVMDVLAKDIMDGTCTEFSDLENRIMEMPRGLEDLYARTLERIEPEYCDESYIMLNMALCSASPLPLGTFMLSARYNLGKTYSRDELDRAHFPEGKVNTLSFEGELRRLASRSGGLLEAVFVRKDMETDGCQSHRVQFIHQTVKEYVRNAQKCLGLRGISSWMLQHNGYLYLLAAAAVKPDEWVNPLRRDIFNNAKGYEKTLGPNDSYLPEVREVLDFITISPYHRSLLSDMTVNPELQLIMVQIEEAPTHHGEFFTLAIVGDLVSYVRNSAIPFSGRLEGAGIENRGHLQLVICALNLELDSTSNRLGMIKALLSRGYDVNTMEPPIHWDRDMLASRHVSRYAPVTPLTFLLTHDSYSSDEKRQLDFATVLLEAGADPQAKIQLDPQDKIRPSAFFRKEYSTVDMTALEFCVRFRSASFVRLLLQYGADPSVISEDKWDLVRLAKLRGDQAIIQELKDHGLQQKPSSNMTIVEGTTVLASNILVSPLARPPLRNAFNSFDLAPILREAAEAMIIKGSLG